LCTETTRLVGVDGPRDKLIKLLTEREGTTTQLSVVSIVGFGGLGKTTLANEVYRKLEGQFDYRAFVSVSQKPKIKKILRHILCQYSCQEFGSNEAWDEQQLINTTRQFLKDKRYASYICFFS
jgi:uridine kinase